MMAISSRTPRNAALPAYGYDQYRHLGLLFDPPSGSCLVMGPASFTMLVPLRYVLYLCHYVYSSARSSHVVTLHTTSK